MSKFAGLLAKRKLFSSQEILARLPNLPNDIFDNESKNVLEEESNNELFPS